MSQRHVAAALTQASFFEQTTQATAAAFMAGSLSSSVPFLFAGLPLSDMATKSGSDLALVLATVRSNSAQMLRNSNDSVAAAAAASGGGTTTATGGSALLSTTHRLIESIGAEAVFLSQQYRALDPSFFSVANTTNSFLKEAGLALLEGFFRRAAFVASISGNVFTRREEDFHLFASALLQLAKFCEVMLAAFKACFVDRLERADASALHAQNRARIDETGAHFVATAFAGGVSKLMQIGLVSVAARVAYTVGDHCSYLVDMVYPTAAALYRKTGTYPSYGSFVHDIEPLLSEQAQALLGKLELIRRTAEQKAEREKNALMQAVARF
jgi:hypothetical protein